MSAPTYVVPTWATEDVPVGLLGFKTRAPARWNRLWLAMWFVTAPGLIVAAFHVHLPIWIVIAVVGFGIPEAVSLRKGDDSLPPLTHTIRHFLPNWAAFPLINFCVGSVGAHWLGLSSRQWGVGVLMGLLGWLTDHFIGTYARPDPRPFTGTRGQDHMVARELPTKRKLPA